MLMFLNFRFYCFHKWLRIAYISLNLCTFVHLYSQLKYYACRLCTFIAISIDSHPRNVMSYLYLSTWAVWIWQIIYRLMHNQSCYNPFIAWNFTSKIFLESLIKIQTDLIYTALINLSCNIYNGLGNSLDNTFLYRECYNL